MPSLNGNWVDLVIIVVLFFFIAEAFQTTFLVMLFDFFSFFLSLVISLRFYPFASLLLKENFKLGWSVSNALGFLALAILSESLLSLVFNLFLKRIPERFAKGLINKFLALFPAVLEGLIFISFVLTIFISFPVNPKIKSDISESKIGSLLVKKTSRFERILHEIFGGILEDTLTYLTIEPSSKKTIELNLDGTSLNLDQKAEQEMFQIINEERDRAGVPRLEFDEGLRDVAREHARDMWERKYFSHYSPEGEDVGDRLEKAGISYQYAGENLALAPTVFLAHNGLMNSAGHRANILEKKFKKVGIGVVDNGYYGKMFVQVFTN